MKRYISQLLIIAVVLGAADLAKGQLTPRMQKRGTPFYNTEVVRFPTKHPDSSDVTVYLKIPYDNLQFVKYDSVYRAKYEVSLVLFDKEGIQADGKIDRHTVEVSTFEETNAMDVYETPKYRFRLHNSLYKLSVGLMDLDTRKTTYRKHTVELEKFTENTIQISDLLIIDEVSQSADTIQGFTANVMNKLNDKRNEFYLYFAARGPKGPAVVEASVLTTDNEVVKSEQDSIQLGPKPTRTYIRMDTQGLNYNRYIYKVKITQGQDQAVRRKDFRVAWMGLSNYIANLDKAIEQMIYILPSSKVNEMKEAEAEEKKQMFTAYWKKRDPSPKTETNELMNEYFRRVNYASQQFGSSIKEGWRMDMGMVYVLFGAPNDIERHPFDLGSKPYEIWYYFEINRQFVFVDDSGFGDYRLVTPLYDTYNSTF